MRKTAQVVEVKENSVTLSAPMDTPAKGAQGCAHCSLQNKNVEYEVANPPKLQLGDQVEIDIQEGKLIKDTLLLYGTPFVFFLVGLFIGLPLIESYYPDYKEIGGFLTGLILSLLSFAILRGLTKNKNNSQRIQIISIKEHKAK